MAVFSRSCKPFPVTYAKKSLVLPDDSRNKFRVVFSYPDAVSPGLSMAYGTHRHQLGDLHGDLLQAV